MQVFVNINFLFKYHIRYNLLGYGFFFFMITIEKRKNILKSIQILLSRNYQLIFYLFCFICAYLLFQIFESKLHIVCSTPFLYFLQLIYEYFSNEPWILLLENSSQKYKIGLECSLLAVGSLILGSLSRDIYM